MVYPTVLWNLLPDERYKTSQFLTFLGVDIAVFHVFLSNFLHILTWFAKIVQKQEEKKLKIACFMLIIKPLKGSKHQESERKWQFVKIIFCGSSLELYFGTISGSGLVIFYSFTLRNKVLL
jgi:hypothetical protein